MVVLSLKVDNNIFCRVFNIYDVKHLKTFEAFIDKAGEIQGLSKNITVNGENFDFDLYDIDQGEDIAYIEGKLYFKPEVEEFEGTIIYDSQLDRCFSEFDEGFYERIGDYRVEFEKFCEIVKKELIR
jgi:hypothetical protein